MNVKIKNKKGSDKKTSVNAFKLLYYFIGISVSKNVQ